MIRITLKVAVPAMIFFSSYILRLLRCASVLVVTQALCTLTHAVGGQPGTLDATFAPTSPLAGTVATPIPNWSSGEARAVALQPDGKVVVGGNCHQGTDAFCAARYLPNGSLDPSFGNGGIVVNSFPGTDPAFTYTGASGIAVQSDGKILQTGSCDFVFVTAVVKAAKFCAIRYLANGTIDVGFSSAGRLMVDVVPPPLPLPAGYLGSAPSAVIVQPDGKIVMAGTCNDAVTAKQKFCVLRLTTSGTPDAQFGSAGDGKLVTTVFSFAYKTMRATSMALQPDGKLVIAGDCESDLVAPTIRGFCSIRVHGGNAPGAQGGTVDTTYGSGGAAVVTVGPTSDFATGVALQADGKVVIGGWCRRIGNALTDMCAARLTASGMPDPSFGINGAVVLTTTTGELERATAVAVQWDGKIVLSGSCTNDQVPQFCVKRLYDNGTRDTSFNGNGTVRTGISAYNVATRDDGKAMTLQPDGKILVVGSCYDGSNANNPAVFCAARYDAGPFAARVCSMDIDGDGRFLATTDGLIFNRVGLGITGNAVVAGVTFAPGATRTTWPLIRDYLVTQCGMSLVP